MKNYKLVEMVANKIYVNKEYGIRYELEKYEDQIKLEYGPQMFRDLQLKVQENREDEVSEWLKTSGFIKSETVEFHEGFVRSQIKKILKETPNSFQGGKPFVRRSDQDHHDAQDSLKEYSEDYIVVYDKVTKKVIEKFRDNKDGYHSGRSKARRFVDAVVKSDADSEKQRYERYAKMFKDNPEDMQYSPLPKKEYVIGKETEYSTMEGSVNEGKGQDLADKYVAQLRQEFKNLNDDELEEFKKTLATAFDMKLNENDYPASASRVYVLMLGNRYSSRGMGPSMVFADKAAAEAEAAKQEAEGRDTKAFVQDLAFIN
jgi:hypothetical protein